MSALAADPPTGALAPVGLVARSRPYRAIARATLRSVLAFRLQFGLSLLSVLFQLVAMLTVWHALLATRTVPGFSWPQMEVYLLVGFSSGSLVSTLSDFRISYKIRTGQVALDLVKPVDYQGARLAETAGSLVTELASICIVWAVMFAFGLRISLPPTRYLALFAVSFALIGLLKFSVVYLTGLLCFWTQNYVGLQWARLAVTSLLSGAVVPLSLLPHWLGTTAQWLPFAGMSSTPGLILIGDAAGWYAVRLVLVQLAWAVALWLVARLAWRGALRQLTIHGG
jgi:ABC-2 type transport system permease protein